jgi:RNA polymerase sigma factor (sigma-70 family)
MVVVALLVCVSLAAWCAVLLRLDARRTPLAHVGPWRDLACMSSGSGDDGSGPPSLTEEQKRALAYVLRPETRERVMRWLHRLCVRSADREDLAQDVLYATVAAIHKYDGKKARPERWLNRIAVFVAAHYHERAQHRIEELRAVPPEHPEPVEPLEDILVAEEERLAALNAVLAIDQDLRAVVVAHDIDGIPMAEIARQIGISRSTAYEWRARGLRALAALLPAQE